MIGLFNFSIMNRLILYLIISFLFSSCIAPFRLSDILAYKYEAKDECTNFEIEGDEIIVKALLNNDSLDLLFDTGVNVEFLFLNKHFDQQRAKNKTIQTPRGKKKLVTKKFIVDIATPSFSINNALGLEMPMMDSFKCIQSFNRAHILGFGAFLNGKKRYLSLGFENHTICSSLESMEITDDYFVLDFENISNKVFVYLTLNGQKQKFLFDTGNNIFVLLDKKENSLPSSKLKLIKEGMQFNTVENVVTDTIEFYNNVKFEEFKNIPGDYLMLSSLSFKMNNIGLAFIKNFNWIFDFSTHKVYVKPVGLFDSVTDIPKFLIEQNNNQAVFLNKVLNDKYIILEKPIKRINDINFEETDLCSSINRANQLSYEEIYLIEYEDGLRLEK